MKNKGILIYGLQRSGTNFLENLLKKNLRTTILNDNSDRSLPDQKHFRLYDQKAIIPRQHYYNDFYFETLLDFEKVLPIIPAGYLVISKDPYSWYLSYKTWADKNNWPAVDHHYIQEYNFFYEKWLGFSQSSDRIFFIRYLDLLREPAVELERISSTLKLKKRLVSAFYSDQISRVSHSGIFNADRREYYLKQQYLSDFKPDEIDEINSNLDYSVVSKLGYQIVNQSNKDR